MIFFNNVKKLPNHPGYRLRVRDWRIVYTVNNYELLIHIINVKTRGEVYKLQFPQRLPLPYWTESVLSEHGEPELAKYYLEDDHFLLKKEKYTSMYDVFYQKEYSKPNANDGS